MAEFNVVQQESINRPFVSNNLGRLNSQTFTFSETSFTKDFYDPQGGTYSTVTVKRIPSVLQLNYVVNPVTVGAEFEADDSYLLKFELDNKYAIHNGVLYEFEKDIDEIITDYDANGLKLIANTNGLLTFIEPSNLGNIQFVQGTGIPNKELEIDFTTSSSVSGLESRMATYHLIPWENVNLKTNYILQSGGGSTGDNPITGFSIVGEEEKTATITLSDGQTLTATFNDLSGGTIQVDDLNTNENRAKIANIGGAEGTEIFETLTALIEPTLDGTVLTLNYRNENDIQQSVQIDLEDIIPNSSVDVNVDRVEWDDVDTNIIKLIETDGQEHVINLTRYSITTVTNADGSVSIRQGGENKITVSKVAISNSYLDLDNLPDLDFDKYIAWRLKVDEGIESEILSQQVVTLLSGENVNIVKEGNTVTFNAVNTDTDVNNFITGGYLNTATGDLVISREGLSDLTINLDGRYLQDIVVNSTNSNEEKHKIGDVHGTDLLETVTSLITPTLSGNILTLKYKNENDVEQSVTVDLSELIPTTDVQVDTYDYDASTNTITLSTTDGDTFSINLSEFSILTTVNADGSVNIIQEGETKITISKVAISNSYNDLDDLPSLDFDKYIAWKLKVNDGDTTDVLSEQVITLLSGNNINITREGNVITFNGESAGTDVNNYITGGSLDTTTGDLTITRAGLDDIIINLDGRYLTEFEETDPTVPSWVKNITEQDIENWNNDEVGVESVTGNIVDNTDPVNPIVNETITQLVQPVLTGNTLSIKYTNENGVTQSLDVDLSSLNVNEINVEDVTYNASTNILTLTETDGTIHTIDLSEFSITTTTDANGIITVTQEGVTKFTISKVGASGDYNDLLNKPDLDFDKYISWKLQVNTDAGDDITSQEVVNLIQGENTTITREGNNITFSSTDTNTDTNNYVTGGSLDTTTGDLTIFREGLENVTINLDGRYLQDVVVNSTNTNPDLHKIGDVHGVDLSETITKINGVTLEGTTLVIKYQNENDVEQVVSVELGGLVTNESGIENAIYNASTNIITLEEVDGDIWDIDLSEFSIIVNTDANGVTELTQEGVVKATLSRVGQTGEYDHLLNKPTHLSEFEDDVTDTIPKEIQIPQNELSELTEQAVLDWLNLNGFKKLRKEFIVAHVVGTVKEPTDPTEPEPTDPTPTEPSGYNITIVSPSEGDSFEEGYSIPIMTEVQSEDSGEEPTEPTSFALNVEDTDYVHLITYGQSLSNGSFSTPAISTENVGSNVMLEGGNNTRVPTSQPSDFIPMVGDPTSYETIAMPWANSFRIAVGREMPSSPINNSTIIGTDTGTGSRTVQALQKGGVEYQKFLDALNWAKAIADGEGKTISLPALCYMQGETNDEISTEDYKSYLITLLTDMRNDVKAIYGQDHLPPVYIYQSNGAENPVRNAHLQIIDEVEWIVGAGGVEHLPKSAGNHLDPNGSRWYGEYLTRAMMHTLLTGERFEALRPTNFEVSGNQIIITYNRNLVIDTYSNSPETNYGFGIVGISGNDVDVEVVDNVVTLTAPTQLVGDVQVRCIRPNIRDADDWVATTIYENYRETTTYPDGIRDNYDEFRDEEGNIIFGQIYPMWNWGLQYNMKIN